jgi:hypothetical protein
MPKLLELGLIWAMVGATCEGTASGSAWEMIQPARLSWRGIRRRKSSAGDERWTAATTISVRSSLSKLTVVLDGASASAAARTIS